MKRIAILAALFAAACGGGGGGSKTNAATTATFSYPSTGSAASGATTASATSALSTLTAFSSTTPDVAGATNVTGSLFDAANTALGGSVAFAAPAARVLPLFRQVRGQALFGEPTGPMPSNCGTLAGNTVTFDPAACTVTDNSTPGETVRGSLSGHVTRVSPGAAEWALVLTVTIQSSQASMTLELDDSGNFALTSTTAKAHEEAAIHASVNASQSMSLGVAQAADLDATLDGNCATYIVAPSTFEAKRVWTSVPQDVRNQNPAEFQNKGVKLVWTGCGTANAFLASN